MFKVILGIIVTIVLGILIYRLAVDFLRKMEINKKIDELKLKLSLLKDEQECIKLQEEIDKEIEKLNKSKSKK